MIRLEQEGVALGWGDCVKYLKRGWNRKEGRGNKKFKKEGQAGSRGVCLIKGGGGREGGWNPLTNYSYDLILCYTNQNVTETIEEE